MPQRVRESWRSALRPVAWVVFGLALTMAACALLGAVLMGLGDISEADGGSTLALLAAAAVTLVGAAGLRFASEPSVAPGRRQATLTVALIWLCAGVFGGLPFVFDAGFSPVDAFFEAVSGFTTTGATIVECIEGCEDKQLEALSAPLLLWRSLTQWLGGMGIVVLFVAVFPMVGVGGKHMFRGEVPGPSAEGLVPRIRETSVVLWQLYSLLTLTLIIVLWVLGVGIFDAVCHSFTALSTGGFSTYDSSVAGLGNPLAELVIAAFMLLAGVNFSLYYGAVRHGSLRVFARSTEFVAYIAVVFAAIVSLTLFVRWFPAPAACEGLQCSPGVIGAPVHDSVLVALHKSIFFVATTLTSTGYGNGEDYMAYPGAALTLILLMMFVGGMAGSTAGGIKVARVVVLLKTAWSHIRASFRPSVVQVMRMDGKAVSSTVQHEVGAFLVIFMVCLGGGTLLITITDGSNGVGAATAFGAMLSCLSNMGPAPYYIESDNFARYSDVAKLVFSLAMVLGRLEFFTLLSLLLPDFWSSFSEQKGRVRQ